MTPLPPVSGQGQLNYNLNKLECIGQCWQKLPFCLEKVSKIYEKSHHYQLFMGCFHNLCSSFTEMYRCHPHNVFSKQT